MNAALTVYMQLAEQDKIPISCNVNIDKPERPTAGDNDLSILLSNVIENAVIASRKQPEGQKEIGVSLVYDSLQYALVVKNRCDTPIRFGSDGLRNFSKKYDAEVFFEQKDGWVRLLMYWSGE